MSTFKEVMMEGRKTNPPGGPPVIPMNTGEYELLSGADLCQKLKIKQSFLYAPVRRKGDDPIPVIRVGKYLRYEMQAVKEWIKRQNQVQG